MKRVPTLNFEWPSLTTCSCGLMLILFATGCSSKPENQTSQPKSAYSGLHLLPFRQDSGFVTKKDGLPFLIANNLTDTVGSYWDKTQLSFLRISNGAARTGSNWRSLTFGWIDSWASRQKGNSAACISKNPLSFKHPFELLEKGHQP